MPESTVREAWSLRPDALLTDWAASVASLLGVSRPALKWRLCHFSPACPTHSHEHSRPYTSTDNPYSEAQFKTLKYRPDFPDRFDSILHFRTFGRVFFDWYNHEHRHSGIGLMTPATVHYGLAEAVRQERARVLAAAYAAHPERFVKGLPKPPQLPEAVWINGPKAQEDAH